MTKLAVGIEKKEIFVVFLETLKKIKKNKNNNFFISDVRPTWNRQGQSLSTVKQLREPHHFGAQLQQVLPRSSSVQPIH